jgi:exodeoxyribonuclease V alpha subunit
MKEGPIETLDGIVERIVFLNEENGWTVLRMTLAEANSEVTAVGTMPGVQVGESLRLSGAWVKDPSYGEQLRVDRYQMVEPATAIGVERYLGSGMIEGIGKELARRLVEHLGVNALEVIDREPERLTEVEGIGPKRKEKIIAAWGEHREIRDIMVFLQSHEVSTAHAVKIFRHYGNQSVATVRRPPYRLAIDIPGIGFKTADRIARSLGISEASRERAEAGVLHALGESTDDGHVFLPREELSKRAIDILEVSEELTNSAIDALSGQDLIVVDQGNSCYLPGLFSAEQSAASHLARLVGADRDTNQIQADKAIRWFEGRSGLKLADAQRDAVRQALSSKVLIITGGPGTGKTTIVHAILRILSEKSRRVALGAPTGRAAKRMQEATGREAKTLHRLLEFNPKRMDFERNRDHPLEVDLAVVDEASMLDIRLFAQLLDALPDACRLVLIGDVDQLPSVGPGRVLADLIESNALPVARLTHVFRQAEASSIVRNAHRINRGETPLASKRSEGSSAVPDDFFFIERDTPESILQTLKILVTERIPQSFGLNPIDQIQVLSPMHRGLLGAMNLNQVLQSWLNPSGPALERGARAYRVGDKVMQIRNNYDLDVFNGDIGRIRRVDKSERTIEASFDGRRVEYRASNLDELVLAYACSIHKSQGSEFPAVIIPLHTQHYVMLRRNLLYTAVTRGKQLVVLVGSRRALSLSIASARVEQRNCLLASRTCAELEDRNRR